MDPEGVLRAATWIVAISLPAAGVWFATSWIRKSSWTIAARLLTAAVLVLAVARPLHTWVMEPFSRAIWRCSICATCEYQVRLWDRCIYRSGRHATFDHRVEAITLDVPHEHDWLFFMAIVAYGDRGHLCNMGMGDEGDVYFDCLGKIPSPEIARRMVERVARASPVQRSVMIGAFDKRDVGEPFESLRKRAIPSPEQFELDYVAWLERHPEWK